MPNARAAATPSPPLFWSVDTSSPAGLRLTYAVRGGARHLALLLFGIAVLAGGLYALYWRVTGGDLTAAGYVFLLVPCGVVRLQRGFGAAFDEADPAELSET